MSIVLNYTVSSWSHFISENHLNSLRKTYEIFHGTRYKSTSVPFASFARRETCFRERVDRLQQGTKRRKCFLSEKLYDSWQRELFPSARSCSFSSSFGLENMISSVPGVYSGATTGQEAGKGVAVVRTLRILQMTMVPYVPRRDDTFRKKKIVPPPFHYCV